MEEEEGEEVVEEVGEKREGKSAVDGRGGGERISRRLTSKHGGTTTSTREADAKLHQSPNPKS